MIEQGIYFALGCVVTALCALGFLPILWNRALRLTRRRLQLQVPVSMQEILAERDQLRAQFAVERLRIEQEMDRVEATKGADMVEIGRRSVQVQKLSDRVEVLARIEQAQAREIALLSRENAEAGAEAGALRTAIDDAYALVERKAKEISALMAERDLHAAARETGERDRTEREDLLPARLEAAVTQAARHETYGLSLRREVDAMKARAHALENELARANHALYQAHEHHDDTRAHSNSDSAGSVGIDILKAENASLRQALGSLRPAIDSMERRGHRDEKADAELRSSIHALGLAVAGMAREARSPSQEPARRHRGSPKPQAVRVEAE